MKRRTWMLNLMAVLLLACPAAGQLLPSTTRQSEINLGREAARQIEAENPLSRNEAYHERVLRIGQALIESMEQKAYPYEFKVLASSEFNAFCLPGGFMYVNEGLLAQLKDDDAVAFVMAHEIMHAAHRHWRNMVEKSKGNAALAILAGTLTNSGDVAALVHLLASMKYSRQQETDADESGMELMWTAGFDTQGALTATQAMIDLERGDRTPKYLRSHPKSKDRLVHLQKRIETLKTQTRPVRPGAKATDAPLDADLSSVLGPLPDVSPEPIPWYPLAVGNTWTYAVKSGEASSEYTVRAVSKVPWKGGAAYRVETAFGSVSVPCQMLTTSDALWRRNRPSDPVSPWTSEFFFVLKEGEPQERGGTTFRLEKPEPVSVPCGDFTDVLHIRQQGKDRTCDLWFARGVGLVRRVCAETGVEENLVAYSLSKE